MPKDGMLAREPPELLVTACSTSWTSGVSASSVQSASARAGGVSGPRRTAVRERTMPSQVPGT
ncbi:hypothetical protein DXK94_14465 [Arthrobacter sp. RT-1]|nr:hypothetical protein DXK94_14465 [Arthrobacter sp. RT-1]